MDGPLFDPATGTHRIALPRAAFDAVKDKQAMLQSGLFADMVAVDDYVWVECEGTDEDVLLRVTGIAAVTEPDREGEG